MRLTGNLKLHLIYEFKPGVSANNCINVFFKYMFFMNSNLSISEQKTVLNFYKYTPHIKCRDMGKQWLIPNKKSNSYITLYIRIEVLHWTIVIDNFDCEMER